MKVKRFELTNQEVKTINRLVSPFVENEWAQNHQTVAATTERGVVITLRDASKILVRVYRSGEKIPEA